MVRGVNKFKEHFGQYTGQYAFIGGTACDIILGKMGIGFRATKDLDMVLLIEALDEAFITDFLIFIEEGNYQHIRKGTGQNQFYRFEKPDNTEFPYMIELFCRKPNYLNKLDARLAPLHVSDDVMSLSAILLDDEYYELLKNGIIQVDEISVLGLEYLILFKMKAWIDLSERKTKGEKIDSKDIKKHKNDVFRLAANIDKDSIIMISGRIREDARYFLEAAAKESVNLQSLGIRNVSYQEMLEVMRTCYAL